MFQYFATRDVSVCLDVFVQNPVFGHNTLSLQLDLFPPVLRRDTSMDAHHVIYPWACLPYLPAWQPPEASQSCSRSRAALQMISLNFEPLLNRKNMHPCVRGAINPMHPPFPTFLDPLCSHPISGNLFSLTHISSTQPEEPADTSDQSRLLHANLVI